MSRGSSNRLNALSEALGHTFTDQSLIEQAVTHPSTDGRVNYQRLEFLGDRVLAVVIAELLFAEYPDAREGDLAVRFNRLVCRETLAGVARAAGLGDHLVMTAAEDVSGGRDKPAILADVCEAVIAALYLDGGFEAARGFILRHWAGPARDMTDALKDAKTRLQERVQSAGAAPPVYREIDRSGPAHAPVFTMEARVPGRAAARAKGSTKQRAEQAAAEAMLRSWAETGEDNGDA